MEDYPDVHRTLAMREDQTFEDLHNAVLSAVNFDNSQLASFYVCNEEWERKIEISLIDMDPDEADMIPIMSETKLQDYLVSKGQKLIYEYDFVLMWRFLLELEDIRAPKPDEKEFPVVLYSEGTPPDQYETTDRYPGELTDEDASYINELQRRNSDIFHAGDEEENWKEGEDEYDPFNDFDEFGREDYYGDDEN